MTLSGYGEEETAEFDRPDTIEALAGALSKLGHRPDKIGNIRALTERLAKGDRWDMVFNIAEGLRGFGREAQVPALLDAYEIPYTFSDPLVLALSLHKGLTKRVLRDLGVATTDFRQIDREADIAKVDLPFPLFVKPVAEGTAKGITPQSRVTSRAELERECRRILETCQQPVLVEPFLGGREFTTGITGTGDEAVVVATIEVVLNQNAEANAYTYVNKEQCEERVEYPLAEPKSAAEAGELALATWRGLNCRDGGRVDLRADEKGRMYVMEVNPLPGLHPEHSDLPILATKVGVLYVELIGRIVASAQKRLRKPASCKC